MRKILRLLGLDGGVVEKTDFTYCGTSQRDVETTELIEKLTVPADS